MAKHVGGRDAWYLYACPVCGARVGERCHTRGGENHKRRENLVTKQHRKKGPAQSVRSIPGGAFEMNRRRH